MSGSNETVCTTENENEHESRTATQVGEIVEVPPEAKNTITEKAKEHKLTIIESIEASSTLPKDVIIDEIINKLQPENKRKKYVLYESFINLFRKKIKENKNSPLNEYQVQKTNTAWIQFSLNQDSSSDFGAELSDNSINYEPGKKNNFILTLLSIATLMWFLTALFLYLILASDVLTSSFGEPGILFTSLIIGVLLFCYFWFLCLPLPQSMLLRVLLLSLTLITVTCIAAMISISLQTELIIVAFVVTMFVTLFILLVSFTRYDLRSTLLYLCCIVLAYLLSLVCILATMQITGQVYETTHMLILVAAVIIRAAALVMALQTIIRIDKKDHILGAFLLYTSIVTFIIRLGKLMGFY